MAVAPQLSANKVLVTLSAGEIELALPLVEKRTSGFEIGFGFPVDLHLHRQSAGLMGDDSSESEKWLRLVGQGSRGLIALSTRIDAPLEIEELTRLRIDGRIARSRAAHALNRSVALRAGDLRIARGLAPKRGAQVDPKHAAIERSVRLLEAQGG